MVVLRTLTIAAPIITAVAKSGDAADTRILSLQPGEDSKTNIICSGPGDDSWCPNGYKCGYKEKAGEWSEWYYVYTCSGPNDPRLRKEKPQPPPPDDDRRRMTNAFGQNDADFAGLQLMSVPSMNGYVISHLCRYSGEFFCGVDVINMGSWSVPYVMASELWSCVDPLTDCPKPNSSKWSKTTFRCEDVKGYTTEWKHCVAHHESFAPDVDDDRMLSGAVKTKGAAMKAIGDKVNVLVI